MNTAPRPRMPGGPGSLFVMTPPHGSVGIFPPPVEYAPPPVVGAERALPAGLVALRVEAPGPRDPTTRAALQVHADLPVALRQRVRAITARSPSAVELVLADGKQVVWGAPGGTATKAAAALVLLRTDSTVVDVSAPGVVVRRGGPSPSPSPQG